MEVNVESIRIIHVVIHMASSISKQSSESKAAKAEQSMEIHTQAHERAIPDVE